MTIKVSKYAPVLTIKKISEYGSSQFRISDSIIKRKLASDVRGPEFGIHLEIL